MLGFDHVHNILTEKVYFSAPRICMKIKLKAGQRIYSYGINYDEMRKEITSPE